MKSIPWRTLTIVAAVLSGACQAQMAQPSKEIQAHISAIENGLLPAVVIEGGPWPSRTLAERMASLNVPGVSIAVMRNGKLEWAKGYGVARADGTKVNTDTLFQAASISKPIAALAAVRLVEQGKLSLDADINGYLTSWKLPASDAAKGKAVTLRHLLTHTGGMPAQGYSPGYAAGVAVPNLVQVLKGGPPVNTPAIRIEAEPGAEWSYASAGYTLMQQAAMDVSHKAFPALLHDMVLGPIGMTRSTFEQPLPSAARSNAAEPFDRMGQAIAGGAYIQPEMAAGGLWTTPSDLALYAMEVRASLEGKSNRVISPAMTKQMLTAGLGSWGLGLQIGGPPDNPWFGHGGALVGFISDFFVYEKSGDGVFIMTNGDNGGFLMEEIERAVAEEYDWPDHRAARRKADIPTPGLAALARRIMEGDAKEEPALEIMEPRLAHATKTQRDSLMQSHARSGPLESLDFLGPALRGGDDYLAIFAYASRIITIRQGPDGKVDTFYMGPFLPQTNEQLKASFKRIDLNSDGKLDRTEYGTMLTITGFPEQLDTLFAKIDDDKNGHLTVEEYEAHPQQ
jgi:CubicO group peptidase (beta-lactamase class C family)